MRTIKVLDRQNIIDVAIQYYGTAAAVIDLCQDNNLELDSDIAAGTSLLIQDTYPDNADSDVADYIQRNSILVVSMTEENDDEALGTNNGEFIITNNNNLIGVSTSIDDSGDFLITNSGEYIITNDSNYIEVPQQQSSGTPGLTK